MLPKHTHQWECKVNEETNFYEQSNESIKVNIYLVLIMIWEIIQWDIICDMNVMGLYTKHQ